MVIKSALRHASFFHAPKRCRIFPLSVHPPCFPAYFSGIAQLREEMLARRHQYIVDFITPTQSDCLKATLIDALPFIHMRDGRRPSHLPQADYEYGIMNPAHHLVYFPKVEPSHLLLPDGTDSWAFPGPPFARRLWAGGHMKFLQGIPMHGHRFISVESIKDVLTKGEGEEQKLYVKTKRVIFAGEFPRLFGRPRPREIEEGVNKGTYVIEGRTLVFLRDDRRERGSRAADSSPAEPAKKPDWFHKTVLTQDVLFRFSALTFNAHAIHLDRHYCRRIEGHRNLLVQGPLTALLVIEVLRYYLCLRAKTGGLSGGTLPEKIETITYKNLRPLYVDEQMKVCVKKMIDRDLGRIRRWDVWIEGPDGLHAVRGTVKTSNAPSPASSGAEGDLITDLEPNPDEESIPNENIAFQNEANARSESYSNEEATTEAEDSLEVEEEAEKDPNS